MKKLLLMVAIALTTLTMSAQEDSKWTVKAGIGLSSVVGEANTDAVFAYKIGVFYDYGISEEFSIIPGIEYASKGFKAKSITGNISMSYFQIPIFAAYKFNISDNMKLVAKAGPYVAYGLFGSDILWDGGTETNIFDSDTGYKRFDMGIIAGVSLDFDQFTVGIEYSRGLTKLDSQYKQYNQAYGLTFGYKF